MWINKNSHKKPKSKFEKKSFDKNLINIKIAIIIIEITKNDYHNNNNSNNNNNNNNKSNDNSNNVKNNNKHQSIIMMMIIIIIIITTDRYSKLTRSRYCFLHCSFFEKKNAF